MSAGIDGVRHDSEPREQLQPARALRGEDQAHGARAPALLEAVGNPTLGQIIRGQLDQHLVAGEHADAVLAHLAGGVAGISWPFSS